MIVSYNWLQKYFKQKLPVPLEVAELLTAHSFEVEATVEKKDDTTFDFKVWTDRAHYALSHRGVALELSAILNIPFEARKLSQFEIFKGEPIAIKVEDIGMCPRYIGRKIENIKVEESPSWMVDKLLVLGQRSINSVVDAGNYVMLDMGQPLHAFDADKVKGGITVRFAKEGESITTLDNKKIKLDPSVLIISDDEAPLAIAGIKGGKRAEVSMETKNIIIEAANFNQALIRKTSLKIGLKTDASKRYENGITSEYAEIGMNEMTAIISTLNPEAKIQEAIDVYSQKENPHIIIISPHFINAVLGVHISTEEIIDYLKKLQIKVEESGNDLKLTIPFDRLDLVIPEDIVEEVGRLYGYEKILTEPLKKSEKTSGINKAFYYREKIKDILTKCGFSEVMTSSLASKGDFEIEKSASDKNFLRNNLSDNIWKSLELNLYNAPLLGLDQIKIFEIGKVFPKTGEHASLCVAVSNTRGYKGDSPNEEIRNTREVLLKELDSKITTLCTIDDTGGLLVLKGKQIGKINEMNGVMELNIDVLIGALPDLDLGVRPPNFSDSFGGRTPKSKYREISHYPFVLRDIAVFVPGDMGKEDEVLNIIKNEATDLLVRADLFDVFTKKKEGEETKTSYAFRLVFQANDRTLTDSEINTIMEKISSNMDLKGWMVR